MSATNNNIESVGRLYYIEPNEFAAQAGTRFGGNEPRRNTTWNPEDLNISVDLQVVVPNRCDCGDSPAGEFDVNILNGKTTLNSYLSFFQGSNTVNGKHSNLTTNYTDVSYAEIKNGKLGNSECLGISSIDISFDGYFYPQVTMNFTDVRGYSLFMPAEEQYAEELKTQMHNKNDENGNALYPHAGRSYYNFFQAIFKFPYPRFLLTIKGFYGTKVTFILAVQDFKTSLNSKSGNFDVAIKFIGYMYGVYTDIPMNLLIASPYCDEDLKYWNEQVATGRFVTYENQSLMTFIEYLRKYSEISAQLNTSDIEGTVIEDLTKANERKAALMKLKTLYENYVKCIGITEGGEREYDESGITEDKEYRWFKKYKVTSEVLKLSANGEELDKLLKYVDEYNESNFKVNNIVLPDTDYMIPYYAEKDAKYVYIDSKPGAHGYVPSDDNSADASVVNPYLWTESGKNNTTGMYTGTVADVINVNLYFNLRENDFIGLLDSEISKCNNLLNEETRRKAASKADDIISEKIGMRLSIENVFRMIFAHLECFMHFFKEGTLNPIKNSGRTFKSLKLSLNGETDILAKTTSNFVPPFFGMFGMNNKTETKESNNIGGEVVYPGNDDRTKEIDEVKLIEKLIEAAHFVRNQIDVMQMVAERTAASASEGEYFFYPTNVLDFLYGSKTPYEYVTSDMTFNFMKVTYMFYLRYVAFRLLNNQPSDSNKSEENEKRKAKMNRFIENEVKNLLVAFPTFPTGDKVKNKIISYTDSSFIDEFKKYMSDNANNITLSKSITLPLNEWAETAPNVYQKMDKIPFYVNDDPNKVKTFSNTYKKWKGLHIVEKSAIDGIISASGGELIDDVITDAHYGGITTDRKEWDHKEGNRSILYYVGGLESDTLNQVGKLVDATNDRRATYSTSPMKGSYYDFIHNETDIKNLYVPFVLAFDYGNNGSDWANLPLTDYYKSHDVFEQGYLLLNALIGHEDFDVFKNSDIYNKRTSVVKLNKLTVLFYGALLWRLQKSISMDKAFGHEVIKNYSGKDIKAEIPDDNSDIIFNNKYGDSILYKTMVNSERSVTVGYKGNFVFDRPYDEGQIFYNHLLYLHGPYYNSERKTTAGKRVSYGDGFWYEYDDTYSDYFTSFQTVTGLNNISNMEKIFSSNTTNDLISYFKNWCNDEQKGLKFFNKNIDSSVWEDKVSDGYGYHGIKMFAHNSKASNFLVTLYTEHVYLMNIQPSDISDEGYNEEDYLKGFLAKVKEKYYGVVNTQNTAVSEIATASADNDKNLFRRSLYYTLKSLYDKWLCSYSDMKRFKLNNYKKEIEIKKRRFGNGVCNGTEYMSELSNFIFVDSFYKDIGHDFVINPDTLNEIIMGYGNGRQNGSVYEFMHNLCEKNKLMMFAIPVYNNFYTEKGLINVFTPHENYNTNEHSGSGFGSTYVVMYTHEPSKYLLCDDSSKSTKYRNDSFDFGDTLGHISPLVGARFAEPLSNDNKASIKVPAFGVTYGMQNQQYFKGITINMDNPVTTDYSIYNTLRIAETGRHGDVNFPIGIGNNIYSIYSNRSYTCTVEMMGCANIMPMMYFQLNNTPMFKGAYMIYSVKHKITAGQMTTTFSGMRVSKNTYPFQKTAFSLNYLLNRVGSNRSTGYSGSGSTSTNTTNNYVQIEGTSTLTLSEVEKTSLNYLIPYFKEAASCEYYKDDSIDPNSGTKLTVSNLAWQEVAAISFVETRFGTIKGSWVRTGGSPCWGLGQLCTKGYRVVYNGKCYLSGASSKYDSTKSPYACDKTYTNSNSITDISVVPIEAIKVSLYLSAAVFCEEKKKYNITELAITAYNAGVGTVNHGIEDWKSKGNKTPSTYEEYVAFINAEAETMATYLCGKVNCSKVGGVTGKTKEITKYGQKVHNALLYIQEHYNNDGTPK